MSAHKRKKKYEWGRPPVTEKVFNMIKQVISLTRFTNSEIALLTGYSKSTIFRVYSHATYNDYKEHIRRQNEQALEPARSPSVAQMEELTRELQRLREAYERFVAPNGQQG